ncbi:MAG: 2-C-methyl-D-erythritol 2,4-cyclodiphosphate synthase [Acidimicrobiales bacterium]|jgi:2-C-methyl-D-erythritol 2,4-cyclodiphosphate synthase
MSDTFRVGQGFDVHRFSDDPTRLLVLGGVSFPDQRALVGHSDADVAAHACTDAILGAAGLGDIGHFFPDNDPAFAGADSVKLLGQAAEAVVAAGWEVVNVDCTLILDEPKLAPHREQMQQNLSAAVGATVSLKGKRTEGVAGLAGGIQGHAVALLRGSSPAGGTGDTNG